LTQAGAPDFTDRSELLANQWAKIGVKLEIVAVDMVTKREHQFKVDYGHTNMNSMDVGNPLESIGRRAMTGAFFTATSMIGMIALAGIIVRNSILLVDFIRLELERKQSLREAVIASGLIRARPIILTAAAVVIGGFVMVRDPIFQGLGMALISGAVVSTALTLVAIPLLYYEMHK